MDGQRFDDVVRSFASGVSRRRALKAMLAGIGLSAGTWTGVDAKARCRVTNEVCRKHGDCCDFFCGPPDNHGRQRCGVCPSGELCGGACCTGNQSCVDDACCSSPCNDNTECCAAGESCVFDGCCPTGDVCNGEQCCREGTECTDSGCCDAASVCESNGNAFCCDGPGTCNDSGCLVVCQGETCAITDDCGIEELCCDGCCVFGICCTDNDCEGNTCCNGSCVDTDNDPQNCGACGNDCGFYLGDQQNPRNCCNAGVCDNNPFSCQLS